MTKKISTKKVINFPCRVAAKSMRSGQTNTRHRTSISRVIPITRGKAGVAKTDAQIIAVTSGKAGVGKTNIVANLGFSLSQLGKRVLILDGDLGLGNIDIVHWALTEPMGSMVVDIGGGTTEVAVISLAGIVCCRSVRVAGDKMDEAILCHIKRNHNLLIGTNTAEILKISIGSAYPSEESESVEVKGRDLVTGFPKVLNIGSDEIREAISDQVETIVETVHTALEQTPPELAADIVEKGIVLTGGGSLLKNLDVRLGKETRVSVTITEDPLSDVVIGSGKALDNLSILKEIAT